MEKKLNIKTSWIYFGTALIFLGLVIWVEIASTTLTLYFFRGLGDDEITRKGTIGFAIANDLVKILAITLGIVALKQKDKLNARIFLIAGILALTVSFFASQAYDLNKAAKLRNEVTTMKNKAKTESGDYKRQESLYNSTKNSLEVSQKQLSNMSNVEKYINSNVDIINLKQQIKDLGTLTNYQKNNNSDYGSKKFASRASNTNKALQETYNNKKNELTNKLAAKENILRKEFLSTKKATENDIKKYNEQLEKIQNGFDKITTLTANEEIETTEGMEQFSKAYGWSIKSIATGKNSYLEFLGVVLSLLMAFCWRMHKKYKELEITGNSEGINISIPVNDKNETNETVEAMAQNTIEMKKDNTLSNLSSKIKNGINTAIKAGWGTEIDTSNYKRKVDQIGFKFEPEENKPVEIDKVKPENNTINKMSKLTKLDFLKFISALYNPATMYLKKYGTGYKKITDQTKLDKTKVKKIRDCLEILEIIETKTIKHGNREMNVTQLNTTKAEALKKIFKIGGVL